MTTNAPLYRCSLCGHCCFQHDMLADYREDASHFGCPACAAWHPGLQRGQGWIALPSGPPARTLPRKSRR